MARMLPYQNSRSGAFHFSHVEHESDYWNPNPFRHQYHHHYHHFSSPFSHRPYESQNQNQFRRVSSSTPSFAPSPSSFPHLHSLDEPNLNCKSQEFHSAFENRKFLDSYFSVFDEENKKNETPKKPTKSKKSKLHCLINQIFNLSSKQFVESFLQLFADFFAPYLICLTKWWECCRVLFLKELQKLLDICFKNNWTEFLVLNGNTTQNLNFSCDEKHENQFQNPNPNPMRDTLYSPKGPTQTHTPTREFVEHSFGCSFEQTNPSQAWNIWPRALSAVPKPRPSLILKLKKKEKREASEKEGKEEKGKNASSALPNSFFQNQNQPLNKGKEIKFCFPSSELRQCVEKKEKKDKKDKKDQNTLLEKTGDYLVIELSDESDGSQSETGSETETESENEFLETKTKIIPDVKQTGQKVLNVKNEKKDEDNCKNSQKFQGQIQDFHPIANFKTKTQTNVKNLTTALQAKKEVKPLGALPTPSQILITTSLTHSQKQPLKTSKVHLQIPKTTSFQNADKQVDIKKQISTVAKNANLEIRQESDFQHAGIPKFQSQICETQTQGLTSTTSITTKEQKIDPLVFKFQFPTTTTSTYRVNSHSQWKNKFSQIRPLDVTKEIQVLNVTPQFKWTSVSTSKNTFSTLDLSLSRKSNANKKKRQKPRSNGNLCSKNVPKQNPKPIFTFLPPRLLTIKENTEKEDKAAKREFYLEKLKLKKEKFELRRKGLKIKDEQEKQEIGDSSKTKSSKSQNSNNSSSSKTESESNAKTKTKTQSSFPISPPDVLSCSSNQIVVKSAQKQNSCHEKRNPLSLPTRKESFMWQKTSALAIHFELCYCLPFFTILYRVQRQTQQVKMMLAHRSKSPICFIQTTASVEQDKRVDNSHSILFPKEKKEKKEKEEKTQISEMMKLTTLLSPRRLIDDPAECKEVVFHNQFILAELHSTVIRISSLLGEQINEMEKKFPKTTQVDSQSQVLTKSETKFTFSMGLNEIQKKYVENKKKEVDLARQHFIIREFEKYHRLQIEFQLFVSQKRKKLHADQLSYKISLSYLSSTFITQPYWIEKFEESSQSQMKNDSCWVSLILLMHCLHGWFFSFPLSLIRIFEFALATYAIKVNHYSLILPTDKKKFSFLPDLKFEISSTTPPTTNVEQQRCRVATKMQEEIECLSIQVLHPLQMLLKNFFQFSSPSCFNVKNQTEKINHQKTTQTTNANWNCINLWKEFEKDFTKTKTMWQKVLTVTRQILLKIREKINLDILGISCEKRIHFVLYQWCQFIDDFSDLLEEINKKKTCFQHALAYILPLATQIQIQKNQKNKENKENNKENKENRENEERKGQKDVKVKDQEKIQNRKTEACESETFYLLPLLFCVIVQLCRKAKFQNEIHFLACTPQMEVRQDQLKWTSQIKKKCTCPTTILWRDTKIPMQIFCSNYHRGLVEVLNFNQPIQI